MWREQPEVLSNKHFKDCTFENPSEVFSNELSYAAAAADGAVPVNSRIVAVTKVTAAALTLAAPTADGLLFTIISDTAAAHEVTAPDEIIVSGEATAYDTITFDAQIGASITLVSSNGNWVVVAFNNVTLSDAV